MSPHGGWGSIALGQEVLSASERKQCAEDGPRQAPHSEWGDLYLIRCWEKKAP